MRRYIHLAYHDVLKAGEERFPGLVCDFDRFSRQMEHLKRKRYPVMTCGQFLYRARVGDLPDEVVTISIDDWLRSAYTNVFPVLRALCLPATFFIITKTLGRNFIPTVIKFQLLLGRLGGEAMEKTYLPQRLGGTYYPMLLDPKRFDIGDLYSNEAVEVRRSKAVGNRFVPPRLWDEVVSDMFTEIFGEDAERELCRKRFLSTDMLRTMYARGMEIASHSDTHPYLPLLSRGEILEELETSLRITRSVARNFHTGITFGYPFGGIYDDRLRQLVRQAGYSGAFNYPNSGYAEPVGSVENFFDIQRVDQVSFEKVFPDYQS